MFFQPFSQDLRYMMRLWRPWRHFLYEDAPQLQASVKFGKENFFAAVDVENFKPEDISVKVSDGNMVTVEGRHEEKQEGNGYISRQFVRRFVLPKGHDLTRIESELSSDGVLSIQVPRVAVEEEGKKVEVKMSGKKFFEKNQGRE